MEIVVHIIIRGMYFTRSQQRRRTRRKKFNLPSYHITSYYYSIKTSYFIKLNYLESLLKS